MKIERKDMNNNVDVVKQLEVKNKEIYYNKLNMDIGNNSEILLITLENSMNVIISELTSKLLEIVGNIDSDDTKLAVIKAFHDKLNEELSQNVKTRSEKIKEEINDKIEIDYEKILEIIDSLFIEHISKEYQEASLNIKNLGNDLDEFNKKRLYDYIDTILFQKIIGKIKESLENMDKILINSYSENLEKYHNLNAKTLNLV